MTSFASDTVHFPSHSVLRTGVASSMWVYGHAVWVPEDDDVFVLEDAGVGRRGCYCGGGS